jgi:recombinational DNA repair protein RecT
MVMAEVVKQGEIFEVNMGKVTAHRKDFTLTDAAPMAVYAIASMPNGAERHVYFAWADVEKRKAKSKAKSGPWLEWPEEMAKAKVISALGKIIGQREFASAVSESEAVLEDWDNVNQDRPEAPAEYDQTVAVEPESDLPF